MLPLLAGQIHRISSLGWLFGADRSFLENLAVRDRRRNVVSQIVSHYQYLLGLIRLLFVSIDILAACLKLLRMKVESLRT
jgi:hypothetical protein